MIQSKRWVLMLVLGPFLFAAPVLAGGGDVNVLFGQKSLSEDTLDDAGVEGQSQFGVSVTLDFQWPVMLAVDLLSSSEENVQTSNLGVPGASLRLETDVDTTELAVGVRKFWGRNNFQPFVGGGLAYVQLDARQMESGTLGPGIPFSTLVVDDDDSGIGLWLNGGVLYRLGGQINVGLDVRYSDASADLTPAQAGPDLGLDSGGIHYSLAVGFHW